MEILIWWFREVFQNKFGKFHTKVWPLTFYFCFLQYLIKNVKKYLFHSPFKFVCSHIYTSIIPLKNVYLRTNLTSEKLSIFILKTLPSSILEKHFVIYLRWFKKHINENVFKCAYKNMKDWGSLLYSLENLLLFLSKLFYLNKSPSFFKIKWQK